MANNSKPPQSNRGTSGLDPMQQQVIDLLSNEKQRIWTFGEIAEKTGLSKRQVKDACMPMRSRAQRLLPTKAPDDRYDLKDNEVWLPDDSRLRPKKPKGEAVARG